MSNLLYTIGYSGFAIDDFIKALHQYGIDVIVDVRSSPYSAYYRDYDKENLMRQLKQSGVMYGNFACEFGARQEDKSLYLNGRLDFEEFAKTDRFQKGITRIRTGTMQGHICALLCAEKDPIYCHRAILVARAVYESGFDVQHIIPNNGSSITKTQRDIEEELLDQLDKLTGRGQINLFDAETAFEKSREEKLIEAYRIQNDKIGFRLSDLEKREIRDA